MTYMNMHAKREDYFKGLYSLKGDSNKLSKNKKLYIYASVHIGSWINSYYKWRG